MQEQRTFVEVFESLKEPRNEKGLKYPLLDVIILALYGTLIGYNDFTNMSYYLKKREDELIRELGLKQGVPSHDVFSDVFRLLDMEEFMKLFIRWTKSVAYAKTGRHIAIDGKAVRAATRKAEGGNIPYVVSAFMCDNGMSIGQKEVGDKTNEITEIPRLLDLIEITDCFVTIDAIGTQTKIMDKIKEKGGHFCLQLKRNQPNAYENVSLLFSDMEENGPASFGRLDSYSEMQKDHGRIEKREYYVFDDESSLKNVLDSTWEHVRCLGMARLTREINGRSSTETHFHLLDMKVGAEKYGRMARGHWKIENGLHWILDVIFGEDGSTANADNGLSNLALLRKMAFNFTKLDPEMKKKTTKKKMIDYMTDIDLYKRLIFETIPANEQPAS